MMTIRVAQLFKYTYVVSRFLAYLFSFMIVFYKNRYAAHVLLTVTDCVRCSLIMASRRIAH